MANPESNVSSNHMEIINDVRLFQAVDFSSLYEVNDTLKYDNDVLKCNLHDIYDVDEAVGFSATKTRPPSMAGVKEDGKFKLLTPK
ncbi:hypothetical protein L1987_38113 [Smallanthus sonchifolius]|uniref:Uncharacterized protein n=1 Tax=Smallanthus sonchifolius TaxID=185202 RepID=A0ACB9HHR5_9ASTR|nr:hypothetical protein L1987_38113 [Smallanthus sonchifolius]